MSRFRRRRNNLYKAVLYVRTEYRSTAVVRAYTNTTTAPASGKQYNTYMCVCVLYRHACIPSRVRI
jgi:hypothetical protein